MDHFHFRIPGWFTFPHLYSHMANRYNNAHFVEVGSFQGASAAYMAVEIINAKRNIKLDCVDTWNRFSLDGLYTKDPDNLPEDIVHRLFLENIKPVEHIVTSVRLPSTEAAKLYPDNSLEFVFIDANHEYPEVLKDILAWLPKVKIGGHIGGHDYAPSWPGVKAAVDQVFAEDIKKGLNVDVGELCWCVYKSHE